MAEELPEDLRDRADDVLSQPKFRANEPSLLDRALDWVQELIGDLLSIVTGGTAFGSVAVGWIILAVMIGLILFFLLRYLPRRRLHTEGPAQAQVFTRKSRRSRAEWLTDADEAEQAGLYNEAVRARYRATVAGLIESDELPETLGATATELVGAFDAESDRTDPFASSTDAFSDAWYGGVDAEAGDAAQVAGWDKQVIGGRSRGKR